MAATVLMVDDEVTQRDLLRRWLERWKYPFRLVEGAHAALEEMAANPADILLVDIVMPEHDGFWLIEQVRAQWPRSVIVVATGVQDLAAVERAKRLDAVDYVTKPFGRELLYQALVRAERRLDRTTNHE